MSDRVKVLHVINQLAGHGGAEVSLSEMLQLLPDNGVDNVVQSLRGYDDSARPFDRPGVTLLPALDTTRRRTVSELRRRIREHRPDVVHTTLFEADLLGRLAGALEGVPTITSMVNMQYEAAAREAGPQGWKAAMVRIVDAQLSRHLTAHLHAITQAVADAKRVSLGVRPEQITVIPRGRDRRRLGQPGGVGRQRIRRELGLDESTELVLNVARQETQKGQVHLVRAFNMLAAARPQAVLVIAGREGGASAELLGAVRSGPLRQVHLLGRREDVPDLLRAADVFAFSSLWEGLGGSVLEAMALECPVVSFDLAPVREVLGGTGLLVPVGDDRALADAIAQTLDDRVGASCRATASRLRFETDYDLDRVVGRMAQLYRDVASGSFRSPPVVRMLARRQRRAKVPRR